VRLRLKLFFDEEIQAINTEKRIFAKIQGLPQALPMIDISTGK